MASEKFKESILVVDDSPTTLEVMRRNLASSGFKVFTLPGVEEAIDFLDENSVDLVITDYKMPKTSGLDLVRHIKENFRYTEVMMITGYASVGGAVEAMKLGADEYLPKPFTDDELFRAVDRALGKLRMKKKSYTVDVTEKKKNHGIIGKSQVVGDLLNLIEKVSKSTATVLITGESGTGKELVARAIHYSSTRAAAPFVPVNCGGIPENLLESELFGYLKGTFTGAHTTRAGFFQTADGGTIFLDEISETSPAMQVKLLRVLQEKKITMLGDHKSRSVDVRIVAASNKDLPLLVQEGRFRQDLYFRLNILSVNTPALRERGDDVIILTQFFARKYAQEMGKSVPQFSEDALRVLRNYAWPGNVRELQNIVQRLVILNEGSQIEVPDLPSLMRFSAERSTGVRKTLAEVEEEHIKNVLASVGNNKSKAAEILGINRKTLHRKLKDAE